MIQFRFLRQYIFFRIVDAFAPIAHFVKPTFQEVYTCLRLNE